MAGASCAAGHGLTCGAVRSVQIKEMLERTVVLKLNGGLGTGMGLEQAKSLLQVKEGKSFLAIIAEQAWPHPRTRAHTHTHTRFATSSQYRVRDAARPISTG